MGWPAEVAEWRDVWTAQPDMMVPRSSHSLAVVQGRLVVNLLLNPPLVKMMVKESSSVKRVKLKYAMTLKVKVKKYPGREELLVLDHSPPAATKKERRLANQKVGPPTEEQSNPTDLYQDLIRRSREKVGEFYTVDDMFFFWPF